jgi:DNA-binding SARP family transcriptional activator
MGRLDLSLLGTPEVRHAGQTLAFPTRKVLALLIYLVVEGGLPSREKLTALFWPESEEGQARASFRRALALLRQALGETAALPHLIVEGDALGFDFTSDFACDLHSFQKAAQATNSTEQVPPGLIERLRDAATLYRGNFLDGFSLSDAPDFDDWVRFQRERWHHKMEELFDRLTQAQEEAGAVAGAIETASRWRRYSPLNEQVYLRLMHLHFVAGDRSAALHVYADCRSMLATELHAVPTPETEALARRIRSQVRPRPGSLPSPSTSLLEGPLVGRDAEYATLKKLYQTAPSHRTQMVVLIGEAGIGKTRLATEFLTWAAVQGADILHGRAVETGGRLPYQPLVEALRHRLEREQAPDDLLSDIWLAELSRLLPELRERYPDLPLPTSGLGEAEARLHLFEAVARLFQALGEQSPVVLFLDDLQWADAASLDLLQYIGRRCSESGTPVLALLTLREEGLAQTPALGDWLSSLERELSVARLLLGPLSAEASMRLLRLLGQKEQAQETRHERTAPALERFGQWLFAETGGHPFFLMETLKALLQQGLLTLRQTESGQWAINLDEATRTGSHVRTLLPASVRELVRARLSRLSPETRELLAAGAVLGHGFTFERLCQVAEMPEREGLRALDEGQRDGLLLEVSHNESFSSQPSYTFAHDKIREVVYAEVGEARRRVLHRRALEVLQRDAAPVTELAHHAKASRLLEPAFRFSVAAGDEAMRLFANTEAHYHYTQALEILSHVADSEDRRCLQVETLLKLVRVSWIAESPEPLLRRLAKAESLARTFTGSGRRLLAHVHYWIGFMSIVRHAMRQAFEAFQQVLVEAQEVDDEELLTLTSVQIARVLTGQGQFGKIEGLLAPVIPRLEQGASWTDWIFAHGFLGIALAARGDYTAGLNAGQRALARAHAMNSYDNLARSHFFLGVMYGMGRDLPHMLEEGSLVVELAQQASDWVFPYLGYGLRGWAESRLGKHEEALESMAHAQAFGRQLGERLLLRDWFAAAHAEVVLAAGRVEDALPLAEVAVELAQSVGSLYSEGLAQRVWGQALAEASPPRWDEAEAHWAASLQALESGEALLEAAYTQVVWGQSCRKRGDLDAAREHFGRAVVQLRDAGLAHEREQVLGYLAS